MTTTCAARCLSPRDGQCAAGGRHLWITSGDGKYGNEWKSGVFHLGEPLRSWWKTPWIRRVATQSDCHLRCLALALRGNHLRRSVSFTKGSKCGNEWKSGVFHLRKPVRSRFAAWLRKVIATCFARGLSYVATTYAARWLSPRDGKCAAGGRHLGFAAWLRKVIATCFARGLR